jgi:RHS repeat-associated protein
MREPPAFGMGYEESNQSIVRGLKERLLASFSSGAPFLDDPVRDGAGTPTALTGSGVVAYTRFVYHGAAVAFETDSGGTSLGLGYTWGPAGDDLLAIHDAAGNQYYVVQDKLHSVRGLVRRDGTWIRRLLYDPYAKVLKDTASAAAPTWELRYRWTGREYDSETGWYYFRARYFDPSVRRFAQEDPIGYGGGGNVYAYANGGPLEARDPGGTVATYASGAAGQAYWASNCLMGTACNFDAVLPISGPVEIVILRR